MSNELAVLIQNNPALVGTGLDEDTLAVAGGRSGGSKRISIKGGVFRKMVGGKEVGSIEDRHMNVIFVKMAHDPSRTYYEGAYQEGAKISPACWSSNSKTPDEDVNNPVAASCASCPKSVKGTGQGGIGSACRMSWRTAVVLPNDPGGDVMQLVLPATSCFGDEDNGRWPFRPYIQMLANNNISAGRVVTKMQFDTKATAPKVMFSPVGAVPAEDTPKVAAQSKSAAAESAVKMTVYQTDSAVEVAAPQEVEEPVLRETNAAPADGAADVSDIVKKWSKKK